MEQRLQKLLASAGVASRREAEKLIRSGRVAVNGRIVTELGSKADPESCEITVDGKPIELRPQKVYVLLNKPRGYVSTCKDRHAPRMVTDLVSSVDTKLFPVGRLDVDTEGLLILTNDGEFAFRITHPKHKIPKKYRAIVRGCINQEALAQLARGVMLEDGMTSPARLSLVGVNTSRHESTVDITITEGRKRQVRRMFEAVGYPVLRLVRTHIGPIGLGKLKPGEWRFLSPKEVEALMVSAS